MTTIERRSAFIINKTIVPINLILFNQQLMTARNTSSSTEVGILGMRRFSINHP